MYFSSGVSLDSHRVARAAGPVVVLRLKHARNPDAAGMSCWKRASTVCRRATSTSSCGVQRLMRAKMHHAGLDQKVEDRPSS
jgi:hypothetical protein